MIMHLPETTNPHVTTGSVRNHSVTEGASAKILQRAGSRREDKASMMRTFKSRKQWWSKDPSGLQDSLPQLVQVKASAELANRL